MELDLIMALLSSLAFFVYGSICIISTMFTFSIDKYHEFDDMLNLDLISNKILTPLDINLDFVDVWLFEHHKIVGSILICLSLIDMKLSFDIFNLF